MGRLFLLLRLTALTTDTVNTFPARVIDMMRAGGSTVTCLPVQIDSSDDNDWQAAVFFRLGGSESKKDIELLRSQKSALSVGIETDLIGHDNATVVLLRMQMFTMPDNPLVGEVLMTPGGAETHYEVLTLLGGQQELTWFLSDENFNLIHQQRQPLNDEWRTEFLALRDESFKRDAMIRLAGKYSAQAAFAEVVSKYSLRG